jgi:hypothetical protein
MLRGEGFRLFRANIPGVRKVLGVLAVIAVLVTTVATFTVTSSDDDDDTETTTTTVDAPDLEDLGETAQQLVRLLESAKTVTYHARFEGESPETPDSVIQLETWQRPPRVRQDSALSAAGQLARTSSFALPTGSVRCTRIAEAPWSCREAAEGELEGDAISESVLARLQGADVRIRATAIDDVDVTCFTLVDPEGTSELCLDEDGITVRVRAGGSELRRVELSKEFDDAVFEPPAEPSA